MSLLLGTDRLEHVQGEAMKRRLGCQESRIAASILAGPHGALDHRVDDLAGFLTSVDEIEELGHEYVWAAPDGSEVLAINQCGGYCNAGGLATAGYGTALGVVRGAVEAGKKVRVFADETRPFLQGARLTAWELTKDAIPVTLITDGMAGIFPPKPM